VVVKAVGAMALTLAKLRRRAECGGWGGCVVVVVKRRCGLAVVTTVVLSCAGRLCTRRGGEGVVGHARLVLVTTGCVILLCEERGAVFPGSGSPAERTVNLVTRVGEASEHGNRRACRAHCVEGGQ